MRIMLNKYFILIGLLLIMTCTAFAEQRGVFMQFHRKVNVGKNVNVSALVPCHYEFSFLPLHHNFKYANYDGSNRTL